MVPTGFTGAAPHVKMYDLAEAIWSAAAKNYGRPGGSLESEVREMQQDLSRSTQCGGLIWAVMMMALFGVAESVQEEFPKEYLLGQMANMLQASRDQHDFMGKMFQVLDETAVPPRTWEEEVRYAVGICLNGEVECLDGMWVFKE